MQAPTNIKDSITFAIQFGSREKKLFKFVFLKDKADSYIAFPYLKVTSFRCGELEELPGQEERTINTLEQSNISSIPVKFSYHESGQVHFKPINPSLLSLPPSYKLSMTRSTPIADLKGNHIFTIHFEEIEHFEDVKVKDKKNPIFFFSPPIWPEQLKLVGFAGFSLDEIGKKYKAVDGTDISPAAIITFTRPNLPKPLILGIYTFGNKSMNTDPIKAPYILSLVGFRTIEATNCKQCLYLHAIK